VHRSYYTCVTEYSKRGKGSISGTVKWGEDNTGTNLSAFETTANMPILYWYDGEDDLSFQFDNPYYVAPPEPDENQKRIVATGGSWQGSYDYFYLETTAEGRYLYNLVNKGTTNTQADDHRIAYDPSDGKFHDGGGATPGNWGADDTGTNLTVFPTLSNMPTHYFYDNSGGNLDLQFDNPYYVIPVPELTFDGINALNLVNIPEDATNVELFRDGVSLGPLLIDGTAASVTIGTSRSYNVRIYQVIDDVSYLIIETPVVVVVIPVVEPPEPVARIVPTGGSWYNAFDYLYFETTSDGRYLYGLVEKGYTNRLNNNDDQYDIEYELSDGKFYDVGDNNPAKWGIDANGTNITAFPTQGNMPILYLFNEDGSNLHIQFDNPYYVIPSDSSAAVTELIFNGSDTINLTNIPEDATKVELFRNGIQLDDMVIDGTKAIVQIGTPAKYQAYIYNAVGEVSYLLVETPILTIVTATGGTVTEIDGFTVHTFTSSGNFVVEVGSLEVEYLMVGGGGGGGSGRGGGGGAGGYLEDAVSVASTTYAVVIGGGGSGATESNAAGNSGTNSTFYNITAIGGGGGGASSGGGTGLNGGSGGGAGDNSLGPYSGGAGTGSQGFAGGMSNEVSAKESGGGGGGASAVGSPGIVGSGGTGGDGGDGLSYEISDTTTYYAGGGGGGSGYGTGALKGVGGLGGGGSGSQHSVNGGSAAVMGTINTGGGGGGGTYNDGIRSDGAAGGSGIVIIRYAKFDSRW